MRVELPGEGRRDRAFDISPKKREERKKENGGIMMDSVMTDWRERLEGNMALTEREREGQPRLRLGNWFTVVS